MKSDQVIPFLSLSASIGAFAILNWFDTNLDAGTRDSSSLNYLACVDGRLPANQAVLSTPGGDMGVFIAALAA